MGDEGSEMISCSRRAPKEAHDHKALDAAVEALAAAEALLHALLDRTEALRLRDLAPPSCNAKLSVAVAVELDSDPGRRRSWLGGR